MASAILTVIRGEPLHRSFPLNDQIEMKIGRGGSCDIVIDVPLASRVHAIVSKQRGSWMIRDCGSRNGTRVNGSKIDAANLGDGDRIRIGNSDLRFSFISIAGPSTPAGPPLSQTLVQDYAMGSEPESMVPLSIGSGVADTKRQQDLLDLFQLSIRLLGLTEPSAVTDLGLDVLMARTHAHVVGLMWADPAGTLLPQRVIPPGGEGEIMLSRKLTELVSREGKAIWVKNEKNRGDGVLKRHADAICVPLIDDARTVGAIHVYRENNQFSEADFDFIVSASSLIGSALARGQQQVELQSSRERLIAKNAVFDELLGESPAMLNLKDKIQRVANSNGCVLVRGESGSGKELVARAIHRASPRNHRPLLCVNCAAIPVDLMESQLFGHKRGAFTGADKDHAGWFQQADTGTLFLDEIGEMTLEGQAKLLRILEGHPFHPVGSTSEVKVDVRVIAATNRDLKELVREKRFREDLFYRLSVFELWIPPLRERGPDIGLLIDVFLDHFRKQRGRSRLHLSPVSRKKLLEYHWPGNVRQLRNTMDSVVVMAAGDEILPSDFGLHDVGSQQFDTLRLDQWEEKLIREALSRSGGNVPEAAELLGISRATLYRKLESMNIPRPDR